MNIHCVWVGLFLEWEMALLLAFQSKNGFRIWMLSISANAASATGANCMLKMPAWVAETREWIQPKCRCSPCANNGTGGICPSTLLEQNYMLGVILWLFVLMVFKRMQLQKLQFEGRDWGQGRGAVTPFPLATSPLEFITPKLLSPLTTCASLWACIFSPKYR